MGQMATGKLEPCKTRLAAARFIVERFRVEPPQDGEDARILAILQVLTEDV